MYAHVAEVLNVSKVCPMCNGKLEQYKFNYISLEIKEVFWICKTCGTIWKFYKNK